MKRDRQEFIPVVVYVFFPKTYYEIKGASYNRQLLRIERKYGVSDA
jgi:hypothetical protein